MSIILLSAFEQLHREVSYIVPSIYYNVLTIIIIDCIEGICSHTDVSKVKLFIFVFVFTLYSK